MKVQVDYYTQMCLSDALNGCLMPQICDQYITETHKIRAGVFVCVCLFVCVCACVCVCMCMCGGGPYTMAIGSILDLVS